MSNISTREFPRDLRAGEMALYGRNSIHHVIQSIYKERVSDSKSLLLVVL